MFIALLIVMTIGGGAGELFALNFWMHHMGYFPEPFGVLTSSAISLSLIFILPFIPRLIRLPRSKTRFATTRKALLLNAGIALCNSLNGMMLTYATLWTPEVIQAFLSCSALYWTVLFSKVFLHDPRSMIHWLVLGALLFCCGGMIVGASPQFSNDQTPTSSDTKYWSMIYAVGQIPGAMGCVLCAVYMRTFTQIEGAPVGEASQLLVDESSANSDGNLRSDDTTVKMAMLATTSVIQFGWLFLLLPADAIPWFGTSTSVHQAGSRLMSSFRCIFTAHGDSCDNTYIYFILFNVAFVSFYVGTAYLNQYSPPLCSMVIQITSPVSAILLMAFPVLNVNAQATSVGPTIGAILLLVIGTLFYAYWEQGTKPSTQTDDALNVESVN